MRICEYGCKQEAKHQIKNGKWCCEYIHTKCPEVRRKNREWMMTDKNPAKRPESRKKLSERAKLNIGPKNPFYKMKHKKETIEYFRKVCGRPGPLHPNWQGGINLEPYCFVFGDEVWREMIYERDGYTCQNCGITKQLSYKVYNKNLSIHHIDHDRKNCEPSNCITLCISCNTKANFNRNIWSLYYNVILNGIPINELETNNKQI